MHASKAKPAVSAVAVKTIGIVGAGQLGRMMALAGYPLGLRFVFLDKSPDSPGGQVARIIPGEFNDPQKLAELAASVDLLTYDVENVSVDALGDIPKSKPFLPPVAALATGQDRLMEKELFQVLRIPTARYRAVDSMPELEEAIQAIGYPAVLKTRRFGYDGKGQVLVKSRDDLQAAWAFLNSDQVIAEGFVRFTREISVIAARNPQGEIVTYVPVENRHKNHILDQTIAPAQISPGLGRAAEELAHKIIAALDYVGVLAVELFESDEDQNILVNEVAPRVHNSGHWTIEAAVTSQFEQHIRAVCGLPLGSTGRYGDAHMANLIGDEIHDWRKYLAEPGVHFHDYGKSEVKSGRKMGHVTRVYPFGAISSTRRPD